MTRLSDTALRRTAWALLMLVVTALALAAFLRLADFRSGGDGALAMLGEGGFFLVLLGFPVAAVLILRSQPRNRIGWLLMAIALVWALCGSAADAYARFGVRNDPEALPGAGVAALLSTLVWVPGVGLMGTFLLLLFPNGRLPSRRWWPIAWLSGIVIASVFITLALSPDELEVGGASNLQNPLGWEQARPVLLLLQTMLLPLLPVCVVACATALVLRFRRSSGVERLQLKWLAAAAAAVAGVYLLSMTGGVLTGAMFGGQQQPAWMDALDSLSFLAFICIPAAVGVAVLKHRLYDIDVVVNRTLVYGTLTLTLAASYIGSVLLLQLLLSPLTSQSDLAVAGSTLLVAALFGPARSRIQTGVDRRFYRSRYDAARTLDEFALRLRSELDLDAIGTDLSATVEEAVHPVHVSLWLRS
ncbi:MAG TPA: hypothetical protein VK964_03970 [Nocardioidaceae bacterium]|nr:hypothetical protein [Nocardioidaceae bacterium]